MPTSMPSLFQAPKAGQEQGHGLFIDSILGNIMSPPKRGDIVLLVPVCLSICPSVCLAYFRRYDSVEGISGRKNDPIY